VRRILRLALFLLLVPAATAQAREPIDDETDEGTYDNPLDPRLEGIYAISIRCKHGQTACQELFSDIDRLTVIDSRVSYGVFLTFSTAIRKDFFDNFFLSKVSADGLTVNATPRIGSNVNRFSYVSVTGDPASGMLAGEILDARNGVYYTVTGHALARLADLHAGVTGVPATEITGVYEGSLGRMPGRLTIVERPDHQIVGSFISRASSSNAPVFRVDFSTGTYDASTGLLRLIFTNPRFFSLCEFALTINTHSPTHLSGHEFCGFALNPLSFKK
jgi:hypothetical protein